MSNKNEIDPMIIARWLRLTLLWLAFQIPGCIIASFAALAAWRTLLLFGIAVMIAGIVYLIWSEYHEQKAENAARSATGQD
jgi:4-amino-4-deoxy-L-arabinose transferase-like glycosyltransferase